MVQIIPEVEEPGNRIISKEFPFVSHFQKGLWKEETMLFIFAL